MFHWLYFKSLDDWCDICIDCPKFGLDSLEQLERTIDCRDIEKKHWCNKVWEGSEKGKAGIRKKNHQGLESPESVRNMYWEIHANAGQLPIEGTTDSIRAVNMCL